MAIHITGGETVAEVRRLAKVLAAGITSAIAIFCHTAATIAEILDLSAVVSSDFGGDFP